MDGRTDGWTGWMGRIVARAKELGAAESCLIGAFSRE